MGNAIPPTRVYFDVPIYEYEPVDRDCLMCEGKVEVLQGIDEAPHVDCPWCGMSVRRVISRASIKLGDKLSYDRAAAKGLTTWKRVEKGKWEKQAGPGVDMIVGRDEDLAAVEQEKKAKPPIDLDAT